MLIQEAELAHRGIVAPGAGMAHTQLSLSSLWLVAVVSSALVAGAPITCTLLTAGLQNPGYS